MLLQLVRYVGQCDIVIAPLNAFIAPLNTISVEDSTICQFLDYLRAERHYSEKTLVVYGPTLEAFMRFAEEHAMWQGWTKVSTNDIREWVVAQMEKGLTAVTVNKQLSALRSFYKYLLRQRMVAVDPTRKIVGPKKEKKLPEFVRESDLNRLFDKTYFGEDFQGIRDRIILLLFYTTGMRVSELTGLDVEAIDFFTSTIKVLGKRNKERIIPFGVELKTELNEYLTLREKYLAGQQNSALILGKTGRRMSDVQVRQIVKRYLSQVTTLRKCSPHVLRHSFATAMLNNGAEIEVVKQLLGHESIATTEIYTHTTFEELKKVYAKAHPRSDE